MSLYAPPPGTFQMSEDLQWTTLIMAALAVGALYIGVKSICDDVRDRWSIEDANDGIDELTDDLYAGRDQHASVPMVSERWVG